MKELRGKGNHRLSTLAIEGLPVQWILLALPAREFGQFVILNRPLLRTHELRRMGSI